MESRLKTGLILILVGIAIIPLDLLISLFYSFPFRYFLLSFLISFNFIIAGLAITYSGLSMRTRGFMLNIIGVIFSVNTVVIIFFNVIWIDSLIALIVVFLLLWFFIFNFSGLYKMITQDDVPLLYKILDVWAILTMIFIVIYTINRYLLLLNLSS